MAANRWVLAVALAGLGLLGNWASVSMGFNVDFLFGSVFGLLGVLLLGPLPGVAVSALASLYTFFLWNHPYAIFIFTGEAAFVALVLRKRPTMPLFFADLAYWLVLGAPLVFLFYYGAMSLGFRTTGVIALKQALNGVSNAVLASLLFNQLPRKSGFFHPRFLRPAGQMLFESTAFLLLLPFMGGLMYVNEREIRSAKEALAQKVRLAGGQANLLLGDWLNHHAIATRHLSHIAIENNFTTSPALQRTTSELRALLPDALNLIVGDGSGRTVAFDPPFNERGESRVGINLSDREWFRQTVATRGPVVSDVFMARTTFAKPVIVFCEPAFTENALAGFSAVSVNLEKIDSPLKRIAEEAGLAITVVDRKGLVVTSTLANRPPLSAYARPSTTVEEGELEGVSLVMPSPAKNISVMGVWREALFLGSVKVESTGWTIITEGPLAPLKNAVYDSTTRNMAFIFLALFVANGASFLLARKLTAPLKVLGALTADIPDKISRKQEISWPETEILEIALLVDNFKQTSSSLQNYLNRLLNANEELESHVALRTLELTRANEKLRVIFDNPIYAIVFFDPESQRIIELNAACEKLYGYSREEALSEVRFSDIVADAPIDESVLGALQRGGCIYLPLRRHRKKNGEVFPVEVVAGSFKQDGRNLTFALIHEISDRVQAQKALAEREEAISAYAKTQRELLREVNHRVKNNLSLLIGMLRMEKSHLGNPASERVIADIECRIQALAKVHSMLSATEWKPVQLREICLQIVSSTLPRDRGATLTVSPSTVSLASSLVHHIALVLNELATNTIKHGVQAGPLKVAIEITEHEDTVEVRYQDNGPGYPPEILEGGALEKGIGMQLVNGIVRMSLYGSVTLENSPGAVTIIRFRKPPIEEAANA